MKVLVFPECWRDLQLVPSARSEFMGCIADVARWNDELSRVRIRGIDSLIGFLFDTYCLEEGADPWIGQLIFADEAEPLQRFIDAFWGFIQDWRTNDRYLDNLHESTLPDEVVRRAKDLDSVLRKRGTPTYVDDAEVPGAPESSGDTIPK